MNCQECKHCKSGYNEEETHCYELRCMKTSKRGRVITWAMDCWDNGEFKKGKARIRPQSQPHWCPLKKEVIKND